MEQKKLHSDLGLDELLNIIQDDSNSEVINEEVLKTDVPAFIVYYQLKNGEKAAHKDTLYKLYQNGKFKKINKASFTKEFSLFFEKKGNYYLLNKDPIELIKYFVDSIKKKSSPKIKNKSTKNQFEWFLNHYEVKKGDEWVEIQLIWYLYDKLTYNTKKRKLIDLLDMIALMRIFFDHRKTKDGYVFKISHNLNDSFIQDIRKAWKRKKQKDHE
jgi:hypothetical protein